MLRSVEVGSKTGLAFNTSKLYLWAVKRLKRSDWCLMRNDKEGAWSIMTRSERRALTLQVLAGGNYEELVDTDQSHVRKRSLDLAKRVADVEGDKRWLAAVGKGWRDSAMVARLCLFLKSHKDQGEVSCRAVHALPCFSLEGLSRWLMGKLRCILEGKPHFI